jgi:hypothetical protein
MCRVKAVRLRRFTLTAAKRFRLSILRCRREGRSLGMKSRFRREGWGGHYGFHSSDSSRVSTVKL